MTAPILLDSEQLSESECCSFVKGGSFGKLAYWVTDERVAQLPVRYAMDAGTIVCFVSEPVPGGRRPISVAFEAYGCDDGGMIWSVLMHGRARGIWRETDLQIVSTLGLPPAEPGAVPIRVIVDTLSGTRSASRPTLTMPLEPPARQVRLEPVAC